MSSGVCFYIECYYIDGSQILGNGDGQAVIRTPNYRRTYAYKNMLKRVGNPAYMEAKVAFARVVRPSGEIVETIKPKTPLLRLFECNWNGDFAGGMVIVLAEDATEAKAICEAVGGDRSWHISDCWSWEESDSSDYQPQLCKGMRYVLGDKGIIAFYSHRE